MKQSSDLHKKFRVEPYWRDPKKQVVVTIDLDDAPRCLDAITRRSGVNQLMSCDVRFETDMAGLPGELRSFAERAEEWYLGFRQWCGVYGYPADDNDLETIAKWFPGRVSEIAEFLAR